MHWNLISLEGNVIFEKVKRLYKLFCICKARNLQRSWDLSLVNVKALMISAYCRKLEKYRCTQMSQRSMDCIDATLAFFSKQSQFHVLQQSYPPAQAGITFQVYCLLHMPIISGYTQRRAFHISPKISVVLHPLLIEPQISQLVPPTYTLTNKRCFSKPQGWCFCNFCQVSTIFMTRYF